MDTWVASTDNWLLPTASLAIVNNAAMNTGVQVSFRISDLLLMDRIWQKSLCVMCKVRAGKQLASSLLSLVISTIGKPIAMS